jgi:hypothetical protein
MCFNDNIVIIKYNNNSYYNNKFKLLKCYRCDFVIRKNDFNKILNGEIKISEKLEDIYNLKIHCNFCYELEYYLKNDMSKFSTIFDNFLNKQKYLRTSSLLYGFTLDKKSLLYLLPLDIFKIIMRETQLYK